MSKNNNDDVPWGMFIVLAIAVSVFCVSCLVSVGKGIVAASQDSGFLTWLAVIGGVALVTFLIMGADGK